MATGGDPDALGELLRSRRTRLAPEDVGLPAGRRQRTPAPTYVKGRRWDILSFNAEACELFTDWAARPPDRRNHVLWMFTSDEARSVYVEWEQEARAMLGRFRLASSRWPGDVRFARLIDRLHDESDLVRHWWPEHHVAAIGSGVKRLRHRRLGVRDYAHVVLQVADDPSQTLVTFNLAGVSAS